MKVDNGSAFQKLIAGKIDNGKKGEKPKSSETQSPQPQNPVGRAAESNVEAAATISRVATIAARSDSSTEEGKEIKRKGREEVERSQEAASKNRVEDVTALADKLASRIKDSPDEAFEAQANQVTQKVHQLLQ